MKFNEQISNWNEERKGLQAEYTRIVQNENYGVVDAEGNLTEAGQELKNKALDVLAKDKTLENKIEASKEAQLRNKSLDSHSVQTAATEVAEDRELSQDEATHVTNVVRNVWATNVTNQREEARKRGVDYLENLTDGEKAAMQKHLGADSTDGVTLYNALLTTGAAGFVPTEVATEIAVEQAYVGRFRARCANVQTRESFTPQDYPIFQDTATGAHSADEGALPAGSAVPAGGAYTQDGTIPNTHVTLAPQRVQTSTIPVSEEMIGGSPADLASYLTEVLGERMARAETSAYTNGLKKINGLMAGAAGSNVLTGKALPNAAADAMTVQDLLGFQAYLDSAYLDDAVVQVNDAVLKAYRSLTVGTATGDRRPLNGWLFTNTNEDGTVVTTLNGLVEIVGNQSIAVPAADAKVGVIHARRAYRIYDYAGYGLEVPMFADYAFQVQGNVGVLARRWSAGGITLPNAVEVVAAAS